MREIVLRPMSETDGTYLEESEYEILLDGERVSTCRTDDMEIGSSGFNPLWERLGLKVVIDDDCLIEK